MDEQQSTVWCLESRELKYTSHCRNRYHHESAGNYPEYTGHCRNRYHLENELLLERLGYSPQK